MFLTGGYCSEQVVGTGMAVFINSGIYHVGL